jgi:hypothetical protein
MVVQPAEIYTDILPEMPVETGDLFFPIAEFDIADRGGVVLTPSCDLAHEKIEWVKLAIAIPVKAYLEEEFIPQHFKEHKEYKEEIANDPKAFGQSYVNDPGKRVDTKTLSFLKDLSKIFKNVIPKLSHYYLPGKEELTQGFLVDFSHIQSVPYNKLKDARPLTRLKSPWREQLLNRYVNFSSRVGTEDYSEDSICQTIRAFYPELTVESILKKMK